MLTHGGLTLLNWSYIRLGKRLMFSAFYYFAFTFLKGCLENKDS